MPEDFFDYQEINEEPENPDFEHMTTCPHCKNPIPSNLLTCYYCGNKISPSRFPKWLIFLILIILISFLALLI